MATVAEKIKLGTPRGGGGDITQRETTVLSARSTLNSDAAKDFSGTQERWMPESMYLQTINKSKDYVRKTITGRQTNNVSDIDGARPKPSQSRRRAPQKDTLISRSLNTSDIFGAQSRPPRPTRKGRNGMPSPNYSLDVSDIDGAMPKPKRFTSNRCVNPLSPNYKLPTVEMDAMPEVENHRFLRDQHDVSDIEGARPSKTRTWEPRDFYNVTDIEGAHPSWKPFHKRNRVPRGGPGEAPLENDAMNVSDINGGDRFKTTREINPMSPQYHINGMHISDADHFVRRVGRRVPGRPSPGRKEPYFPLHTHDISGAQADTGGGNINRIGTLAAEGGVPITSSSRSGKSDRRPTAAESVKVPFIPTGAPRQRKDFRRTNLTQDIKGAQHDTLRRGLKSKRQTDPLDPQYQFLNGSPRPDSARTYRHMKPLPPSAPSPSWSELAATTTGKSSADGKTTRTTGTNTTRNSSVDGKTTRSTGTGTVRKSSVDGKTTRTTDTSTVPMTATEGGSARVTPSGSGRGTPTSSGSARRVQTTRQSMEVQRQRKADILAVKALPV